MAMAIDWAGVAGDPQDKEGRRRRHLRADALLAALLTRHDDRLLRDAGLSRDEVLDPEESFRRDWARHRAMWSL